MKKEIFKGLKRVQRFLKSTKKGLIATQSGSDRTSKPRRRRRK